MREKQNEAENERIRKKGRERGRERETERASERARERDSDREYVYVCVREKTIKIRICKMPHKKVPVEHVLTAFFLLYHQRKVCLQNLSR